MEQFKNQLKYFVKSAYGEIIQKTYPVYKQLNIIREGGDDLGMMGSFIDEKRGDCDVVEASVDSLSSVEILNTFEPSTDAQMMEHVSNHMPYLTKDEQKLTVVVALSNLSIK